MRAMLLGCLLAIAAAAQPGPAAWRGDLAPIEAADWSYDRAAHLLERAGFGGTPEEIRKLAAMSPRDVVRRLVRYQEVENVALPPFRETGIYPSPEWTRFGMAHTFAAILQGGFDKADARQQARMLDSRLTGVTAELARVAKTPKQAVVDQFYLQRNLDLLESQRAAAWLADRMVRTRRPLEEKLVLFWHGHFATGNEKVRDYRMMLNQFAMLRENANGGVRDLLIGIGQDPAMLLYLDNNQNYKGHANENFAREIMELFALGVGNYTEQDIKEAARAFTGWTLTPAGKFVNRAELHDEEVKNVLGKSGNFAGEQVVDILLEQQACARFLSRKLYKFFVREELSPELEEKLAGLLRTSGYQVAPLLEAMFLSRDFYSAASYATQIKSPVQLVVSTYRKLGLESAPSYPKFAQLTAALGQQIFYPPNVKGWDGGRAWVNPATMFERSNTARYILFPEEMPVYPKAHLEGSRRLSGDFIHEQFLTLAAKGNLTDFPSGGGAGMKDSMNKGAAGSSDTMKMQGEDFNLFRGVFNAAWRAVEMVPPEPRKTAEFRIGPMLQAENVTDAPGAVDALMKRFLRAPLQDARRAELVKYLEGQLGSGAIDFSGSGLEKALRELLHLILSTPEYQLS